MCFLPMCLGSALLLRGRRQKHSICSREDTDDVCSFPLGKEQGNRGEVTLQALVEHSATKCIQEIALGLIIHL